MSQSSSKSCPKQVCQKQRMSVPVGNAAAGKAWISEGAQVLKLKFGCNTVGHHRYEITVEFAG